MKIRKLTLITIVGFLAALGQTANAQSPSFVPAMQPPSFGQPVQNLYPPGYNPVLQMLNPRETLTTNYFNLVAQTRIVNNFQQLQDQSINTRRGLVNLSNPIAMTSSKVGFNTHAKYFESNKRNFGVNNTTNSNIRPPVTDESLLRMYRPGPSR